MEKVVADYEIPFLEHTIVGRSSMRSVLLGCHRVGGFLDLSEFIRGHTPFGDCKIQCRDFVLQFSGISQSRSKLSVLPDVPSRKEELCVSRSKSFSAPDNSRSNCFRFNS